MAARRVPRPPPDPAVPFRSPLPILRGRSPWDGPGRPLHRLRGRGQPPLRRLRPVSDGLRRPARRLGGPQPGEAERRHAAEAAGELRSEETSRHLADQQGRSPSVSRHWRERTPTRGHGSSWLRMPPTRPRHSRRRSTTRRPVPGGSASVASLAAIAGQYPPFPGDRRKYVGYMPRPRQGPLPLQLRTTTSSLTVKGPRAGRRLLQASSLWSFEPGRAAGASWSTRS